MLVSLSMILLSCGVEDRSEIIPQDAKASPVTQQIVELWPASKIKTPSDESRINEILNSMSVEDKVGQLIMAEIRNVTPEDVKKYRLGGILNGGGAIYDNKHATAQEWVERADEYYQASIDRDDKAPKIPVIWGTDAVHGHSNVVGATIFPHNIGLGATRNAELIKKIGQATAKEVSATGIYWTFAPNVTVPLNDRWGRIYESYAEDPKIVTRLSTAMIEGLQGTLDDDFLNTEHILATAKHFIGDGGTTNGKDQGDAQMSETELSQLHGQGYVTAIEAGVQTIMVSLSSWNGTQNHGNKYLITDVLKNKMGFDGIVVGDWNGHGKVAGCSPDNCAQSVNAGMDMLMVPKEWKAFHENTLAQVQDGSISMARIDDAVRRILRVKIRLGLLDDEGPRSRANAGQQDMLGHPNHRALARQAVSESLVLLKNNNNVLPIKAASNVLVVGDENMASIPHQIGGWTLTWQGTETTDIDFPGSTRIVDSIQQVVEGAGGNFQLSQNGEYQTKPDVAIVVLSEPPYSEMFGDRESVAFSPENRSHMDTLKKLRADGIPVITLFISGRALYVSPELENSDAFVAAWLPGTEGNGVTDVLFCPPEKFSVCGFKGKLGFSWPRKPDQALLNISDTEYDPLFKVGYGLRYGNPESATIN